MLADQPFSWNQPEKGDERIRPAAPGRDAQDVRYRLTALGEAALAEKAPEHAP
jgi:hypothetical protein